MECSVGCGCDSPAADGYELVWSDAPSTTRPPPRPRLNFQVGGWLGDPDATTVFPADFEVDHVRVWQR